MKLSIPRIETGRHFFIKKSGILYEVGNVYSYTYIPIHKDKLKFYDKNPLILFMEYHPRTNLLFGVNLHFLPLNDREELVNAVMDMKDNIQREFRWENIYNDPRFRYLPIAMRKYKLNRIGNAEIVVDMNKDEEINRADLHFKRRSIVSESGFKYNQTIANKMSRLAKQNKDWMYFLKAI